MTSDYGGTSVEAALARGDACGVAGKLSLARGGALDVPVVAADVQTPGEEDR
jgi:hypothetical protein